MTFSWVVTRAMADVVRQAAQTAFFPSLYDGIGSDEKGVAPHSVSDYVGAVMTETKRLRAAAAAFNGGAAASGEPLPPIIPWTSYRYERNVGAPPLPSRGQQLLSASDLRTEMLLPKDLGASGILI